MREIKLKPNQTVIGEDGREYIIERGDYIADKKKISEKIEYLMYNRFKKREETVLPLKIAKSKIRKVKESQILKMALDHGLKVHNYGYDVSIVIDIRTGKIFTVNYDIQGTDADTIYEYIIAEVPCYTDEDLLDFFSSGYEEEEWRQFSKQEINSILIDHNFFNIEIDYDSIDKFYESVYYYDENGEKVYPF